MKLAIIRPSEVGDTREESLARTNVIGWSH